MRSPAEITFKNNSFFQNTLKYLVFFSPALLLAGAVSCSKKSDLTKEQSAIQSFNDHYYGFFDAAEKMAQRAGEVERIATSNGAFDLSDLGYTAVPDDLLITQAKAMDDLEFASRRTLVEAFELLEAAHGYDRLKQELKASGGSDPQQIFERDFGFTALLILGAGVVLGTTVSVKQAKAAQAKYCEDVRNILATTLNQSCLDRFAEELGVPSSLEVTSQNLVTYLENLPAKANVCATMKLNMKLIQDEMQAADPPASCAATTAQQDSASMVQMAKDTMELAKDMGMNGYNTVLGTGISRGVQIVTKSEDVGNFVDLVISATKTAATKLGGTMPADETVSVAVVPKETIPVTVPPATVSGDEEIIGMSIVDQAKALLKKKSASAEETDQAVSTLVRTTINTPGTAIAGATDSYGAITVDAPQSVFLGEYEVDGLQSELAVKIPNLGFSTTMVITPKRVPDFELNVDTAAGATIGFPPDKVADLGEEKPAKTVPDSGLNIVVNTADPTPGQDVELLVYCPASVVFPATLEGPAAASGTSVAWASPINKCPVTVIFSADAQGSYPLNFTLTDANGAVHTGSVNVTIGEAASGSETWTDPATGLTWESARVIREMNWDYAQTFCQKQSLGGYTDWRLPNIDELRTLVRGCPAAETGGACGITDSCNTLDPCGTGCTGCESNVGPGPDASYSVSGVHPAVVLDAASHFAGQGYSIEGYEVYMSSTVNAGGTYWALDFRTAQMRSFPTSDPVYQINVRCVR